VLTTCAKTDKPVTLHVDEYKILEDQWMTDLECLLKNNISSEVIRKNDFIKIISHIKDEIEQEKKYTKLGLSIDEIMRER
jgi:hypothetical protein